MRTLLFSSFLSLLFMGVRGQVYNTGVLYVGSGNTLYTTDFINSTAATYQNDGSVYITGDITNDEPSLPAGAGTTYLTGILPQNLFGTSYFRSFNVTLNNPAGLTLANRLAIGDGVGGSLTFTAGLITAGTSTQDAYFYPGSSYTGFDAGHHIIGYTTKSGNTDFTFPIGNGVYQADLDLTGLSATADFQVLYNGSGYGTYTANPPIVAGGIFTNEWWNINLAAGTATAQVTLKWNNARNLLNTADPADLVVADFVSGAWQSEGGSSSNAAGSSTGTVGPSNAVSAFGPFTFGSTIVPLPIILGSFTVRANDCQANLAWTTEMEENADGFEVQQSTDGINYTTVAFVKAKGLASAYSINVPQAVKEAFYRIALENQDGSLVYSGVAVLQLNCLPSSESLSVYPNPMLAGADITVRYSVPQTKGEAQLQVFDITGKKIQAVSVQVSGGVNIYSISSSGLAQGVYTIVVVGDGWRSDVVKVLRNN
jgi:type IX secretion system substrate protein